MTSLKKTPLVRSLEILPGALAWTTFIMAPILSFWHPVWIALYIIVFDFYWFLKGANVAVHLLHSYAELQAHNKINWLDILNRLVNRDGFVKYLEQEINSTGNKRLKSVYAKELAQIQSLPAGRNTDWTKIYHVVVLAAVNEGADILSPSIDSYVNADYDKSKIIFALAIEDRAGAEGRATAAELEKKYAGVFRQFIVAFHPDNIPGEVRGKAGNFNFAAKVAAAYMDAEGIKYEDAIFSGFDSDTVVSKNYFAHLTYDFLTTDKPHQTSYQPLPVFNNNIWDTPAVARVVAVTSSFWQLIEASRPDRMVTFSSHAMSFKTLVELGYFKVDSVNEDSYIFWQGFLHFNGDYRAKPIFTLVSMDAVLGETYWSTMVAQYKQKRRWAYGSKQVSEVLPLVWANKRIPLWKRFIYTERMIEGYYFWATSSIMLAVLGWLPLFFGGDRFGTTVLAFNLPLLTRVIMSVATFFLIFSVYINFILLPPRPEKYTIWKSFSMFWQWVFSPIVASIFGSVPAIDAQTKLMFGNYMESFWVTPKFRKK